MISNIKSGDLVKSKILLLVFVCVALLIFPAIAIGAEGYVPLAEIPGVTDSAVSDPAGFFNGLVRITIVIAAFLAIIMIMVGGFEYMVSEVPDAKSAGKKRITDAVAGLLLILLSVLLLNIINPDIVSLRLFN